MVHLIQVKRSDLVLINKKKRTYHQVDFAPASDYKMKIKESKKLDKLLDHARKLKKVLEHERDIETNHSRNNSQRTWKILWITQSHPEGHT